jgi:two-component system cell cycle sensor histidine kinase/response regulator CckA
MLEEQVLQSQKLESIGQLAGGLAHDFNNLLTVILGSSTMMLSAMDRANLSVQDNPGRDELTQIAAAAQRAAALTRKLLAFGRRNEFEPRVVPLNEIIFGVEPMLRRLIEAHVEMVLSLAAEGDLVCVDPGLIEQVVVNLVVNARDAMPEGGRLFIETSRVNISGEVAAQALSVAEGSYVSLAITDTGTGMTPEVQARVFEPFFTTKESGHGTGLGLAMAYGVVRQCGGSIRVHSARGIGTTIRILLPVTCQPHTASRPEPAPIPSGGTETVLLVEDEAGVRRFIRGVLEDHGYRVLDAGNGIEAIELARSYGGSIDLLLTDIVLPGMKSADLIRQFQAVRPGVTVLRMSGYPDRFGAALDSETPHLAKPFTAEALLSRIRKLLDTAPVLSE